MAQPPNAVALHVCEQVIYEAGTNNYTIVNGFSQRFVNSFPALPFPFDVFAVLTDGQGEMLLELIIERPDNLEEIYRRQGTLELAHPLQERRCHVRVRSCTFPVPGAYQITLLVDGEPIANRRLYVLRRPHS
jgi:hypothetical protein